MPTVLHFDTLTVSEVEIRIGGELRWTLRDDVPTATLLRAFEVIELEERLTATQGQGAAAAADAYAAYEAAVTTHCGAIIRHTYPDVTDDEVARTLSMGARLSVLKAFFSIRLPQFSRPRSVSPAAPTEETPAAPATQPSRPGATQSRRR
jgi:hypothetical protein